jgi:hypothetical protein
VCAATTGLQKAGARESGRQRVQPIQAPSWGPRRGAGVGPAVVDLGCSPSNALDCAPEWDSRGLPTHRIMSANGWLMRISPTLSDVLNRRKAASTVSRVVSARARDECRASFEKLIHSSVCSRSPGRRKVSADSLASTTKKLAPSRSRWPTPASRKPVTVSCDRVRKDTAVQRRICSAQRQDCSPEVHCPGRQRARALQLHIVEQITVNSRLGSAPSPARRRASSQCRSAAAATTRGAMVARTSSPMTQISLPSSSIRSRGVQLDMPGGWKRLPTPEAFPQRQTGKGDIVRREKVISSILCDIFYCGRRRRPSRRMTGARTVFGTFEFQRQSR